MSSYITDVAAHFGIGTLFACTGACTRHFCSHFRNKIIVGGGLILLEAAVMVPLVG